MSYRYGDGDDYKAIIDTAVPEDDTAPVVSKIVDMRDADCVSFQVITEDAVETITVEEGDDAVAADDELNFAGFDFTGLEDAIIRIEGSEDNDGDHIITTGGDGTAVCAGSTLVNETFALTVSVTVIRADDPVAGAWTFEASNNYQAGGIAAYGQAISEVVDWSSVTAMFDPDAVTAASSQLLQANLRARSVRAVFTPTSGQGTVRANVNAKGWA